MSKLLSTQEHGIIDFTAVGTLIAVPRIFRWEADLTRLVTGAAASMLGYSLLTRYQMGVIKLLPMKAHLVLDGISGGMLMGLSFLLGRRRPGVIGTLAGIGAAEIAVALLTKTKPPLMVQMEPVLPNAVPERVSEAINQRLAALRGR
jgi:hypothetical protein